MVPGSKATSTINQARHETDKHRALNLYQQVLDQLHAEITRLEPGTQQDQLIQQFKEVLVEAEALKQPAAVGTRYEHLKQQAKNLAEQAVAADGRGELAHAFQQYCRLLEVLNKCHNIETVPAVKVAIMARFQVYLERAEVIRQVQQRSHLAKDSSEVTADK